MHIKQTKRATDNFRLPFNHYIYNSVLFILAKILNHLKNILINAIDKMRISNDKKFNLAQKKYSQIIDKLNEMQ